jgi:hypothetical protein
LVVNHALHQGRDIMSAVRLACRGTAR